MSFELISLNDGNKIPALAYGTGSKMKRHDITQYIEQAIEMGFSHIDTAAFYETEKYVGKAIKESGLARSEFFITTKYPREVPIQKSIKESLANLGLEYVDLYLIHQPRFIPDLLQAWKDFEKVQQDGLAKSIGISNVTDVQQLESLIKASNVTPAVNQIELHPYNYHTMKPIVDACAKHNIVIEAYSSLSPITTYPGGPVDVPLQAAARRIGATPTQVVFLWVRAKGAVIVTTTTSKAHMAEYLAVADLRQSTALTKEEVAAIDNAGARGPPSSIATRLRLVNMKETMILLVVGTMLAMYGLFGLGNASCYQVSVGV
ncbi:Aldo/keto reductase [Lentinula raphanica]|uniref:Aldo/keto reductase n=1 Tax=Lentinula raphanica TaxID=153919 RepID=A0AA38PIB0_9AGAR|nr:Aldo/keto reductase [Lentinula raphanica]